MIIKLLIFSFYILICNQLALSQSPNGGYTIGGNSSDYQTITHNSFDSNDEVIFFHHLNYGHYIEMKNNVFQTRGNIKKLKFNNYI